MPRSSGGTYTLYTPGNPVVTNTVISSTWANNTLTDLATAMTDSLSRSGQGGMTAPLQLTNGAVGTPALTWGAETTAGLYRAGAGDFRFAVGGQDVWRFVTGGAVGFFGNGAVGAPAISWASETNSGMYRSGAADFRWAVAGADAFQLTTNMFQMFGTAPTLRFNETDAAANNKLWDIMAGGEDLQFSALTDALTPTLWMSVSRTAGTVDNVTFPTTVLFTRAGDGQATTPIDVASALPQINLRETDAAANNRIWGFSASAEAFRARIVNDAGSVSTDWLQVDRTGTTVDTINFSNGTLQYGAIEVGYRGMPRTDFSTSTSTAAADAGRLLRFTGGAGQTFTADSDIPASGVVIIMNDTTNNLTLAASTLQWYNGSGTIPAGSRTLAGGGIATLFHFGSSSYGVWGIGLT